MNKQIKSVVIVGGGTAGWLSAAYLNRAFGENISITLIESSDVDPIGVGEATIPTMKMTMEFLGFKDHEWMPHVGASYKSAINFVNWIDPGPDGKVANYWHPFIARPEPHILPHRDPFFTIIGNGYSINHYALKKRLDGSKQSIAEMVSATPALCKLKKSPRNPDGTTPDAITAYHIDAGVFGGFLRKTAVQRGVKKVIGHVEDIKLRDDGFIESVRTKDGNSYSADLFVDCTGFRSILLNGALEEPFISSNSHLLCNSAVAILKENDPENEGIEPYTTAYALKHGWSWDIPLFNRNGCGYVYSNEFTTAEQAEQELRTHLGERCMGSRANHIKMRVGQSRNYWVKNCVGIGLSASFIEPLESTSIFFSEYGLANLVNLFPDQSFDPARIKLYNSAMREMFEETRDFIVLHYYVNKRTDTDFWRAAREDKLLPDSLREKIELFKSSLPLLDLRNFTMFRAFNYTCILDGCNALPTKTYPTVELTGYDVAEGYFKEIREISKQVETRVPSHYEYLKSQRVWAGIDGR